MAKQKTNGGGGGPAAIYKMVTDRIIQRLEEGVIPWRKPWRGVPGEGVPANLVSKRPYQGINELLLGSMDYDSPWWVSIKQARQLGGAVRKGESPMPVTFWKRTRYKLGADSDWNGRVEEVDGQRYGVGFLLRYYKVWNVEQCDGLADRVPEPVEPVEFGLSALDEVLTDYCTVEGVRLMKPGGDRAYYNPMRDAIKLPPATAFYLAALRDDRSRLTDEAKAAGAEARTATHAHECAHSTGVEKRLNRDMSGGMGSESYSREELVAEMCAQMLCTRFGVSNERLLDNAASYVAHWRDKLRDEPQLLMQAGRRAQDAAEYIAPLTYDADTGDTADAESATA